jgi:hypothetical protein
MTTKNLVLRTVYIDPDIDDELRNEAFSARTSKNDLFRRYLVLGMEAARQAAGANALTHAAHGAAKTGAAKPGTRKASAPKPKPAEAIGSTGKSRVKRLPQMAKAA